MARITLNLDILFSHANVSEVLCCSDFRGLGGISLPIAKATFSEMFVLSDYYCACSMTYPLPLMSAPCSHIAYLELWKDDLLPISSLLLAMPPLT